MLTRPGPVLLLVLLLAGCGLTGEDPAPLQSVDWRNGPYATGCTTSGGPVTYEDGEAGDLRLGSLGYAELDGEPGDEAVLVHACGEAASLSVWTGSADGPVLLGDLEPPEGLVDGGQWSVDRGVLCVALYRGDTPDSTATTRSVRVTSGGLEVLDLSYQPCEVPGVETVLDGDAPDA